MTSGSFTIPGNPALEGAWLGDAGGGVAVVAPPHPMMGGHLSNPVVATLAEGIVAAHHRALRFNFRGVGESYGEPSGDPNEADEDFRAAMATAATSGLPLVAAGYSFGAAAALRAASADRRVRAVVAVAPPVALVGEVALEHLGENLTIIAAERDPFAPVDSLRIFATAAPRARFEVVRGADHFFASGLGQIAKLSKEALESLR